MKGELSAFTLLLFFNEPDDISIAISSSTVVTTFNTN